MKKKLIKGSDEWELFQDYWKFRQEYYEAENQEFFDSMMQAGCELIEKYKNTEIEKYGYDLVMAHMEDVDRRWKLKNVRCK